MSSKPSQYTQETDQNAVQNVGDLHPNHVEVMEVSTSIQRESMSVTKVLPINPLIERLVREGYKVVPGKIELKQDLKYIRLEEIERLSFPRNTSTITEEQVFFIVNDISIFQHVAEKTTLELDRRVKSGAICKENGRKYYSPVTANEIIQVLAFQFFFHEESMPNIATRAVS